MDGLMALVAIRQLRVARSRVRGSSSSGAEFCSIIRTYPAAALPIQGQSFTRRVENVHQLETGDHQESLVLNLWMESILLTG